MSKQHELLIRDNSEPPEFVIQIGDHDHENFMVGIRYDGSVKFGENYDLDETARLFWRAIGARIPLPRQSPTDEAVKEAVRKAREVVEFRKRNIPCYTPDDVLLTLIDAIETAQ